MGVGECLAGIGDLDPDRVDVFFGAFRCAEFLPHKDGVCTGFGIESSGWELPEFFALGAVLGFGDEATTGEGVGECADFACRSAGSGLAGEALGAIAGLSEMTAKEVDGMDEVVDGRTSCVLVDAHAPEADNFLFGIGEELGEEFDFFYGYAGELGNVFGCVWRDFFLVSFEGDGCAFEGGFGFIGVGAEVAIFLHKGFVVSVVFDEEMGDAIGEGKVCLR